MTRLTRTTMILALLGLSPAACGGADSASSELASDQSRSAAISPATIEKSVRQLLTTAEQRDYQKLLISSSRYNGAANDIRRANPKSLWPDLLRGVTDSYISEFESGHLFAMGPDGLAALVTFLSFPHKIVEIEGRVVSGSDPVGEAFVTIEYPDPLTAPVGATQGANEDYRAAMLRRAILVIRIIPTTGEVRNVTSLQQGLEYYPDSSVPFRITGVIWTYFSKWQFVTKVVGGTWPLSIDLDCGEAGRTTLPDVTQFNSRIIEYIPMDSIEQPGQDAQCTLRVQDAAANVDTVAFEISRPAPRDACWVRPEYLFNRRLAVEKRCGNSRYGMLTVR